MVHGDLYLCTSLGSALTFQLLCRINPRLYAPTSPRTIDQLAVDRRNKRSRRLIVTIHTIHAGLYPYNVLALQVFCTLSSVGPPYMHVPLTNAIDQVAVDRRRDEVNSLTFILHLCGVLTFQLTCGHCTISRPHLPTCRNTIEQVQVIRRKALLRKFPSANPS
jgi:hypothetical protein